MNRKWTTRRNYPNPAVGAQYALMKWTIAHKRACFPLDSHVSRLMRVWTIALLHRWTGLRRPRQEMACAFEDKTHLKDSGKGRVAAGDGTPLCTWQRHCPASLSTCWVALCPAPLCKSWHVGRFVHWSGTTDVFALKINPVTILNRESNKPNQIYRNSRCILDMQTWSAYLQTEPDRSAEMRHILTLNWSLRNNRINMQSPCFPTQILVSLTSESQASTGSDIPMWHACII